MGIQEDEYGLGYIRADRQHDGDGDGYRPKGSGQLLNGYGTLSLGYRMVLSQKQGYEFGQRLQLCSLGSAYSD